MERSHELTVREPLDTAVTVTIVSPTWVEVSVDCLGTDVAFRLPSLEAADQLAIALADAVHIARKREAVSSYVGGDAA